MVANYTSPNKPPYFLHLLDEKESCELFCKKVFLDQECPSDLEPLGRSIVGSCRGLPLAIITLAGLVAKRKRTEQEWLRIKVYVSWHLAQDKTKVMDVLKLIYDYLPRRLKPCFLYLGIYPEDYEIPAKELIQLWIAEGFIQPHESGAPNAPEPEDVGEEYLDELVDRCLIQVTSTRSYGGVKTCKIHDLLRELFILESKANNSLQVITESNIHTNTASNLHRLSFLCNAQSFVSSSVKANTRSLFFFARGMICTESSLKNFQSTHVLHLHDQVYFTSDSSDLETMIHLKYLRLKWPANKGVYLPYYIWNLPKLETLDLEHWPAYTILNGFWKLDRLRHVYMRWSARLPLPPAAYMAQGTTMWNLQTLYGVALDQTLASLFSNNIFPNLRTLGLEYNSQKDNNNKSLLSRFSKKKPDETSTSTTTRHELLRSLKYLTKLCRLKLRCGGSSLSSDAITAFPPSLIKITLSECGELDSRAMNSLGQLSNLLSITIHSASYEAPLSCGVAGDHFPRLQVLKVEDSFGYRRGVLEGSARMPPLGCVVIKYCRGVSELPQELWSLTTLQKLHIVGPSEEFENSLRNVKLINNHCKLTVISRYMDNMQSIERRHYLPRDLKRSHFRFV